MKYLYSIIFLLISITCNSQEINKKLFGSFKEKYSVSLENQQIKNGFYTVLRGKRIVIDGYYNNDIRSGIWTIYSSKKDIEFIYNYTLNEFIFWKCQDKFQDCSNKKRPAYFIDGFQLLSAKIAENLVYPQFEDLQIIQGTSIVTIEIDKEGRFHDCYICLSSGNFNLDKEAIIAVKNVCNYSVWFPAIDIYGMPIADKININISFFIN